VRRKRGHNVAVTALGRKLVVLVWHLLTKREACRYAEELAELAPQAPEAQQLLERIRGETRSD
jgi:hypothetical protein